MLGAFLLMLLLSGIFGYIVGTVANAYDISPWIFIPVALIGGYLIGKYTFKIAYPSNPYK